MRTRLPRELTRVLSYSVFISLLLFLSQSATASTYTLVYKSR